MGAQKSYILFLFSNVFHLILFMECSSDKVNFEYEYRMPVEKRIRRSLTTICVEIKPSHPQEEPYLMCKGGQLPGFEQRVPYNKNNIYVSNDHNIISTQERNYVPRQPFPYIQNLKSNENSWSKEGENYQNTYLSNRNPYQHSTFDAFKFSNGYTQPTHFNSDTTTSRLNSDRSNQRFSTSLPPILSSVVYRENNETPSSYHNSNKEYLETENANNGAIAQPYGHDQTSNEHFNSYDTQSVESERWNLSQNTDNPADPLQHSEIKTAFLSGVKQLSVVNDAIQNPVRSRDNQYEWDRKKSFENGLELNNFSQSYRKKSFENGLELNNFSQSYRKKSFENGLELNNFSQSYREKQIFNKFNTLPFGDDPVMQQFYNSLYDTPVQPIIHLDAAEDRDLNTLRSQSMQEDQCDDFRKEARAVSEAPSNQYCNACPPEMGYTLPPIIITLPCYNPSDSLPCYRSVPPNYNSLRHENFVPQNQYLKHLEPTELAGSSYNPLVTIFQPKLLSHFGLIPRLGALLGSARTILPTLHVPQGIFRGATPIPGTSQPNTLAPQPISMEVPPTMYPNDLGPHIGDAIVAAQLDNNQTTILPTPTAVVPSVGPSTTIKSTEDLENSTEDSSVLQNQSQVGNFTTIKPIAITRASTITDNGNQAGEESTKKMLTIIEKARRLQMRHRLNSN
uniref:Pre-mRNA-processing ATP-dependent RNA helicase prp5 n=1 Tax=Zeugodacus cucurbitae TaxID=28588 RepID=A0A0A1X5L3_ZEUCU